MNRKLPPLPPFPLLVAMGAGVLLRIGIAWSRFDRVWPDEHFQTIEPAAKLFHGYAYLAWEWLQGYRSWILAAFHLPFFWIGSLFGMTNGLPLVGIVRTGYALADAAVWLQLFHHLDRRGTLSPLASRIGVILALLAPTTLLWSVTSLQDHLAMLLFWGALPWIVAWTESHRPSAWFAAGFLLVVPAWPKLQMLAACGIGGIALLAARWRIEKRDETNLIPAVAGAAGGALLAVLFYGCVDLAFLGRFAGSALQQFSQGEQISRQYGMDPWWSYFPRTLELLGTDLAILLGLVGVSGLALRLFGCGERDKTTAPDRILLAAIAAAAIAHFAVHSGIPHKETRFLLPILPAFLVLPLALVPRGDWELRIPRLVRNPAFLAGIVGIAAASAGLTALNRPIYLTSVEVGSLEEAIRSDRPRDGSEITLCLIGHNWSWTRGSVGVGGPVRTVERDGIPDSLGRALDADDERMAACDFAIVRADLRPAFEEKLSTLGIHWREIAPAEHGFTALARATP